MYLSIVHLLFLLSYLTAATKLCYAPDGSLSPGDGYMPCINTINVDSMCCVLNVTALELIGSTAADADSCATNGLCQISTGEFARDFCTDQTWQSPNCLKKCTEESSLTGGVSDSFSIMTHCADGSWCCGKGNETSCCDISLGFQLEAAIPPYVTSKGSAILSTATVTMTAVATETISRSTISGNGTNNVAIGLGVALGVVILGAAASMIIMFRRLRELRLRGVGNIRWADSDMHGQLLEITPIEATKNELEQPHVIHEVAERKEPVEMDGGMVVAKGLGRRSRGR